MAGQRLEMMDLRQLIQLKLKGTSNRKTADALKVSRNTVNSYVACFKAHSFSFEELLDLNDKDLSELFPQADYKHTDRYGQLSLQFPHFAKQLTKTGCTLQTLWHTYLEQHPGGYRYTQFTQYYKLWNNRQKPSGILLHKAGDKLFVDYTGSKLHYVNRNTGEMIDVEVFVATLPCSQYTFVKASASQKREDFIDGINSALQWIGGVPKAIVTDNLKSAVSKGHKYAPEINKTLQGLAVHYNCVIDPTRPYHPKDKALVEGAVKLVYQRIFYPLSNHTFFSIGEINEAIMVLLAQYNQYSFQNAKTTRRQRFEELEQTALSDLPSQPYHIRYYKRAKVQKIGHIFLSIDKNYYSVPYRYIGHQVEVQYNNNTVEIFYKQERVASHTRNFRGGAYSTVEDHLSSAHKAYNDMNPEIYKERARGIGAYTLSYIDRLFEQSSYPEQAYKQAQGILSFVKHYQNERVEKACKRGMDYHKSSYKTVEKILANKTDLIDDLREANHAEIPAHENIRGPENFS
jgi:transposase